MKLLYYDDVTASIYDDEEYIITPMDNQKGKQNDTMVNGDDTHDPAEYEHQLNRVRDWVKSYHLDKVEVTDALSAFADISLTLIEDIMEKLVDEGTLVRDGKDIFSIMRPRNLGYEFDTVKNEGDGYFTPSKKSPFNTVEGHMYIKALYHALPMDYTTISKLQSKLGREANQTTVHKLMDKMTKEGYIAAINNRKLGKRVTHYDLTKKKLAEVQSLGCNGETLNGTNNSENQIVHSIGSDLTRTKERSNLHQNVSNSIPTISKLRGNGHSTPTSKNQPIASIESYAAGSEKGRNGNANQEVEP